MEQWRQLKDYPLYEVNEQGDIRVIKNGKVLKYRFYRNQTITSIGPKSARIGVTKERAARAFATGSIKDAALTQSESSARAAARAKQYLDTKWEATHQRIMPIWNSGEMNTIQIAEALGLGINTVRRHLKAEGISAQQAIYDKQAEAKKTKEAEKAAAKATAKLYAETFRDMVGEQLELFPKTCETCGRPISRGKRCAECSEHTFTYDHTVTCTECGKVFTANQMGRSPKYCPECAKLVAKRRSKEQRRTNKPPSCKAGRARKACREHGVKYEPIDRKRVFERDGWMCYICHEPLHREYDPNDPLSPTIDHVLALNNGGSHTYDNVRACHAICNSRKCCKPVEEVLENA